MIKGVLNRLESNSKQTLGHLTIYDNAIKIFDCYTLELPDLDNQPQISRIPEGSYKVIKRRSKKFGRHFHIQDVQGRSYILIHAGNYFTQILGCILVGHKLIDINNDGERDVTNSKFTLETLLSVVDEFNLTIL